MRRRAIEGDSIARTRATASASGKAQASLALAGLGLVAGSRTEGVEEEEDPGDSENHVGVGEGLRYSWGRFASTWRRRTGAEDSNSSKAIECVGGSQDLAAGQVCGWVSEVSNGNGISEERQLLTVRGRTQPSCCQA